MKEKIRTVRMSLEQDDSLVKIANSMGLTPSAYIKKKLFQDQNNGWESAKALLSLGEISTAVNKLKYKNEDEELNPYIDAIERSVETLWQIL